MAKTVSYPYDASIHPDFNNLNETETFKSECTLEGLLIQFLRYSEGDFRVWLKPEEWIKAYYGFSDKQLQGVLLLSQLGWSAKWISVLDLMQDFKLTSLTKRQSQFLSKMLKGANGFQEGIDVEIPFKIMKKGIKNG